MKLNQVVEEFLTQAIESGGWMILDRLYLRNRVYGILEVPQTATIELEVSDEDYLGALMSFQESRQLRSDQLADMVTPPPSVVNALFAQRYEKDPYDATDYFYGLNQLNKRVAPVQASQSLTSTYGQLAYYQTPKNKLKAEQTYPQCDYCMETEGYEGTSQEESHLTQRMIRMNLQGDTWNYHFVRDPFWPEDCLFTSEHHEEESNVPTKIGQLNTLNNLFPHYFVASLGRFTHHPAYIGGQAKLPVSLAETKESRAASLFKGVTISTVMWPVTTIRLTSQDSQMLKAAVEFFVTACQTFVTDEPVMVFCDREETKQVDIIFAESQVPKMLTLGILSDTDSVIDFEGLDKKDGMSGHDIDLDKVLGEL